jgi:hypothetical protein
MQRKKKGRRKSKGKNMMLRSKLWAKRYEKQKTRPFIHHHRVFLFNE